MKIFKKEYDRNYILYGGLIITFAILYLATAFVSFYHAITFFNIANAIWLSVILSFVAEIGQASVLFSILLTDNKNKFLPWAIMIILTSLQVIGNVVSSFDWIVAHNDAGLDGFKRAILFAVQTDDPEMFRIIVAWISGALLPVIALSMTALVAQNMDLRRKNTTGVSNDIEPPIDAKDIIGEVSKIRPTNDEISQLEKILDHKIPKNKEEVISEKEYNVTDTKISSESSTELHEPIDEDSQEVIELPEKVNGSPFDEPIFNPDMAEDEIDGKYLDEEISSLSSDIIMNQTNGLVEGIIPKVIELPEKVKETPSLQSQSDSGLTNEQLERIRQIARENIKKK